MGREGRQSQLVAIRSTQVNNQVKAPIPRRETDDQLTLFQAFARGTITLKVTASLWSLWVSIVNKYF